MGHWYGQEDRDCEPFCTRKWNFYGPVSFNKSTKKAQGLVIFLKIHFDSGVFRSFVFSHSSQWEWNGWWPTWFKVVQDELCELGPVSNCLWASLKARLNFWHLPCPKKWSWYFESWAPRPFVPHITQLQLQNTATDRRRCGGGRRGEVVMPKNRKTMKILKSLACTVWEKKSWREAQVRCFTAVCRLQVAMRAILPADHKGKV